MFRSQIYFLLSNINSDMAARLSPGISISDTSTLTDILIWVNWYHLNGRLTDEEYGLYEQVDYTFAQQPFTFMHELLYHTQENDHWWQIETKIRCRYCRKFAEGTRLWLVDLDGNKKIAPVDFGWRHPGNLNYEPVCCVEHPSCVNQPANFFHQELPI